MTRGPRWASRGPATAAASRPARSTTTRPSRACFDCSGPGADSNATSLWHDESAVDAEHLPGDPGCPVAGQEGDGGGDVVRFADAARRIEAQHALLPPRVFLLAHLAAQPGFALLPERGVRGARRADVKVARKSVV